MEATIEGGKEEDQASPHAEDTRRGPQGVYEKHPPPDRLPIHRKMRPIRSTLVLTETVDIGAEGVVRTTTMDEGKERTRIACSGVPTRRIEPYHKYVALIRLPGSNKPLASNSRMSLSHIERTVDLGLGLRRICHPGQPKQLGLHVHSATDNDLRFPH
jgi:hypothetical protein